jgi:hypothetical protein
MLRPLPTARAALNLHTFTVISQNSLATLHVLRVYSANHRQSLALITLRRPEKTSRYCFGTSTRRMDLAVRADQMLA